MPIRRVTRDPRTAPAPVAPIAPPAEPIVVRSRIRVRAIPPARGRGDGSAVAPKRAHHVVDRTTDNWDEDGDYIVGRGRPPVSGQWQKGQSGNPRGPKPKEKLTPQQAFEKELLADFTAKVNGEDKTLNLGTFVLQLLKSGAAKGTVKSQQLLLELFLATVRRQVEAAPTPEIEAWEQELIEQMLKEHGLPERPVVRADRDVGGSSGGAA